MTSKSGALAIPHAMGDGNHSHPRNRSLLSISWPSILNRINPAEDSVMVLLDTLRIFGHALAITLMMFGLMWLSGAFAGTNHFQKQS